MNIPAVNLEAAGGERGPDTVSRIAGQYRRVADKLPGAAIASVRAMRDEAIAAFAATGLPHRRIEEWKYTDLRRFMTEAYAPAEAQAPLTETELRKALGELAQLDAIRFVFVNGHFNHDLSVIGAAPPDLELMTLAKALYAPADWVLNALGRTKALDGDVVSLLNIAFMTDGIVLRLGANTVLDLPLHIVNISAGDMPFAGSTHNLIVAGEGAEATIIESHLSLGETPAQVNIVTEIRVGDGAKIRHYKISSENEATQHLASAAVELGERSDYLAVNFADGNGVARHQTFLRFGGDGARGQYYGAQLLRDRQHCDMTLLVDHDSVGCESREHVKAVLADRAHGVFQAKVVVRPGAQQTDGRQMAQGLLLSDDAEFDAKPELEIYADDVKCNHGATFGSLDEDQLFYLRARGIPEDEARSLLIQAFVGEVFDHVENDQLRTALLNRVAGWLG
jgi:Fe-S cluster assembly protein SufD